MEKKIIVIIFIGVLLVGIGIAQSLIDIRLGNVIDDVERKGYEFNNLTFEDSRCYQTRCATLISYKDKTLKEHRIVIEYNNSRTSSERLENRAKAFVDYVMVIVNPPVNIDTTGRVPTSNVDGGEVTVRR